MLRTHTRLPAHADLHFKCREPAWTDDVRASLDFLDRVIEEYNSLPESVAEQTSLTPEGDDDPSSLNGNEVGDSAAEALEAPEHFSINLVIVNEVVK
ncbi:unnamed protein product, partial [Ixodes persulcatus]